ncbi:hypothetical protein D3C72_1078500 [compost metagenome]
MQEVGQLRHIAERIDQRIAELQRVRGGETDATDTIDLGDGADQQAEVGQLAVAMGAAVGVDVLAEQVDLAHALRRKLCHLHHHVLERAADFGTARVGHHAERAVLAAAFHDRHERRRAIGTRFGHAIELLDFREADVHLRALLFATGADQLRQAMQCLRAEHQVDERRTLDDRLAFLRRHAAADADDDLATLVLQALPDAQLAEHLLLRLFADRAGVDQDDVGVLRTIGQFQAIAGGEHVGHLGRVVLVHLATVGLDVQLALHLVGLARTRGQGNERGAALGGGRKDVWRPGHGA